MNKKRNIYIEILCGIILILLLGNAYMRNVYDTKKTVTKKMKAYLREKYKEDFEIYALRLVNGGYSAYIIPSNDVNTPKGDDDFYEATVAMRTKPIYFLGQHMFNLHKDLIDTQWRVEVKEKFNSLIGKEIEKLFGKNYLTALEMKLTRDLLKKEKFSHTMTEEDIQKILTRNEIEISGGIYIFGRVESEADREYYRKQIYEFIQYLKAENMFDYTNIEFYVKDERMLSKGFNENIEDKNKIIAEKNFITTKTRGLIYQKYEKDFKNTPQKYIDELLNNIIKSNIREETYNVSLLYFRARSKKLVKSRELDKDERINAKISDYNTVADIEFDIEGWNEPY